MVRLAPLESVAGGNGLLFKRLLTRPELRELKRRGLIGRANNARYFHGHVSGKVGVRPGAPVYLGVHSAENADGEKVAAYEHPDLRHLHYESPSLPEFVRKWTALAVSGPPPGMRDRRALVLEAFVDLAVEPDPQRRDHAARELYEEFVAEDADALDAAGVLEHIDVLALPPTSTPMTEAQRSQLDAAVEEQGQRSKLEFLPGRHGGAATLSRSPVHG